MPGGEIRTASGEKSEGKQMEVVPSLKAYIPLMAFNAMLDRDSSKCYLGSPEVSKAGTHSIFYSF